SVHPPLSLHDALPILRPATDTCPRARSAQPKIRSAPAALEPSPVQAADADPREVRSSRATCKHTAQAGASSRTRRLAPGRHSLRSEEHTSELQSRFDL